MVPLFKIELDNGGSSSGKIKTFICRLGSRHHHLFLQQAYATPTVVRRTSRMSRVESSGFVEYTKNIFSPIRSPPDLFLRIQATWPGLPGLKQVLRGIAKLSSNLTTAVST